MAKDENNGREKKWTAVRLPRELKEQIDRLIETHPELGYGGPADFVRDSVRRRMEELKEMELQNGNRIEEAIEQGREIVKEIMGPEGLEVFDRKLQEASMDTRNSGSADMLTAMKRVLRDLMGKAVERSISERIYEREVEKNE